ncbi:hypothetical protein BaRGS_00004599 [Batillaria attramentaria]|uniref:Uncharacterized protein n=1 Tax=Batillaria attramentaria TaxID=370345 RepID=A0ABD0LXP4_9CAEN
MPTHPNRVVKVSSGVFVKGLSISSLIEVLDWRDTGSAQAPCSMRDNSTDQYKPAHKTKNLSLTLGSLFCLGTAFTLTHRTERSQITTRYNLTE